MGKIIFHKKPNYGRGDDPHGVTTSKLVPTGPSGVPKSNAKGEYDDGPPKPTPRVKISSEPPAATRKSTKAAKKSQKSIKKSGINEPESMAESAKRGKNYDAAKLQETSRLDMNQRNKKDDQPTGIEKAYRSGGSDQVDEYHKSNSWAKKGKPPEI